MMGKVLLASILQAGQLSVSNSEYVALQPCTSSTRSNTAVNHINLQ